MHCNNTNTYWCYWKKKKNGVGNTYHIELNLFSDYHEVISHPRKNDYFDYEYMDKIVSQVDISGTRITTVEASMILWMLHAAVIDDDHP